MTAERDTTRIVRSWLEEGRTALPDHVLDAVLDQLPTTRQRRSLWPTRRDRPMSTMTKLAVAAAAVLLLAVAGFRFLPGNNNFGGPPSPSPTSSPAPTGQLVVSEGPLALGTWAFEVGPVTATFDIAAAGWLKNIVPNAIWTDDSEGRFSFALVSNLYRGPCDTSGLREPPIGPTVADLATALATLPGVEAAAPVDASLGGYSGKLVEFSLASTAQPCGEGGISLWPLAGVAEAAPLESGARTRYWILDVEGTRLVVGAVERDELPVVRRNELQSILDSIRLEP